MIIQKLAITIKVLAFLFLVSLILSSCSKDEIISTEPSYKLEFSSDTIIFDTVFTTVGSTTGFLKVFNRNKERISISHIYLAKGSNSQYQINVDGTPGISLSNIELAAEDSLFIFIKVTVDPTNQNSPLIISDSIVFETNGNIQDVDLAAWGQDAHFFVGNKKIEGLSYPYIIVANEGETVTWEDDKPYVIYGWAVVDSTGILNIGPGCNIHFHQNSGLWVYRGGSIHVNGELDSVVTFQGDRLEMEYDDLPGQWDRIWINESSVNSEFNYAVVKNGFIGIQAETTKEDMGSTLHLNNTIIENMSLWGMFTVAYRVNATNSVFANCAEKTLFLSVGGNYDFRHCTFANFWTSTVRLEPSFVISNNLIISDENGNPVTLLGDLENAYFGNCIVYGSNDEEIILSNNDQVLFDYKFDHCILKTVLETSDLQFYLDCQKNIDPLFVDQYENNYRIDTLSPAINMGSIEIVNGSPVNITLDLDGNLRNSDEGPDLGAYEFIPQVKNRIK
jgi:hypothetical protein